MVRGMVWIAWVAVLGCAAPAPERPQEAQAGGVIDEQASPRSEPAPTAGELAVLRSELVALRQELEGLRNGLGHLETKVDANNPEGELRKVTIDTVRWSDEAHMGLGRFGPSSAQLQLLCHLVEWDGYGRLLRFIRHSDKRFVLEAPGQPDLAASMVEGAICDRDGSTRFAVLQILDGSPSPGVEYAIRPRNEVEGYRWNVLDGVRTLRRR